MQLVTLTLKLRLFFLHPFTLTQTALDMSTYIYACVCICNTSQMKCVAFTKQNVTEPSKQSRETLKYPKLVLYSVYRTMCSNKYEVRIWETCLFHLVNGLLPR